MTRERPTPNAAFTTMHVLGPVINALTLAAAVRGEPSTEWAHRVLRRLRDEYALELEVLRDHSMIPRPMHWTQGQERLQWYRELRLPIFLQRTHPVRRP